MSMNEYPNEYPLDEYGLVFSEKELLAMASTLGLIDMSDEIAWEVAGKLHLSVESEFTGEANYLKNDGTDSWTNILRYDDKPLYIAYLSKTSTIFESAYKNAGEVIAEMRNRFGKTLPADFSYRTHLRHVVGTYIA